jgi:hypothetical protein
VPPEPAFPPVPARTPPPKKAPPVRPSGKNNKEKESWGPMTETEMVHFNSDTVGLGELFAKLEPVVKAYAREHTRKPPDVSRRLNSEGHRTAAGDAWTPRLVGFLLAFMFNDSGKHATAPRVGSEKAAGRAPDRPRQPAVAMDDRDEIARRLSSLGRVTISKDLRRRQDSEK